MALIIIDNIEAIEKNRSLLDIFFTEIYEPAFPDRNEREEVDDILYRTAQSYDASAPKSVVLLEVADGEVVGGEVIDVYCASRAIEIIYLAVRESKRGCGVARRVVIDGTKAYLSQLKEQCGVEIEQVYFETNNPFKTSPLKDNFDMINRLEVFARLGAKWIDIDYIQPALSQNRQMVDNLYLMVIPALGAVDKLSADSLKSFLKEFYEGLGESAQSAALLGMYGDIDKIADAAGVVALKDIPMYERESNVYRFDDAVATIHYATDIKADDKRLQSGYCRYFNSYETDLMSYGNQQDLPLQSRFVCRMDRVKLCYPYVYSYSSEGRLYYVCSDEKRRQVEVDVAVNYSVDKQGNEVVAHLTLTPSSGGWFTEHDIIKLTTLYGSKQERYTPSSPLLLSEDGSMLESFEEFLNRHFLEANYDLFGTGITRLELSACKPLSGDDKCVDTKSFFSIFATKSENVKFDEKTEYFASVLCGIILGIFDYERMTDEEICDTIRPIVCRDKSFITLCRGNLVKIECDAERAVLEHIVVSPYLLMPSTVLMLNEMKLRRGHAMAEEILARKRSGVDRLSEKIEGLKKIIYDDYLVDIFQYRSEIEIVKVGEAQRRLNRSYQHLVKQIDILSSRLNYVKSLRSNFIDSVQGALLLCLTITQVKDLFYEMLPESNEDVWFFGILLVIFVGGVFVGRYRK